MKLTPILAVDRIEDSLPFWVDRMGFEKTTDVPGENGSAFVILVNGGAELMLQTIASIAADMPSAVPPGHSRTYLFIEVDDFPDTLRRLSGYPVAMEQRDTFYGMREIGVIDPAGNMITFAARIEQ